MLVNKSTNVAAPHLHRITANNYKKELGLGLKLGLGLGLAAQHRVVSVP